MGWFTLKSGYDSTVASAPSGTLTLPVAAFPAAGSSVTLTASKTFDTGNPALASSIAWDPTCAAYMTQAPGAQPGPGNPAQQTILVKAASLPPSATTCYGTATSGMSANGMLDPGVRVAVNLPAGLSPLTVLPAAIALPVSGQTLVADANIGTYSDPGAIMNRLMGGGIALAASTCTAIAYTANFAAIDTNAADDAAINAPGGCYTGAPGTANGPLVNASEPGFNSAFGVPGNTCGGIVQFLGWNPASANGPNADLGLSGSAVGQCAFSIAGASGSSTQSVSAKVTGGCVPGQVCGALGNNIDSDPGVPCVIRPGQPPRCVLPYFSEVENQYASFDGGFTWASDGVYKCSGKVSCTASSWTGVSTPIPASSIRYNGSNSYDTRAGITSGPCTWTPTQPPGTLNGGSWPNPGC